MTTDVFDKRTEKRYLIPEDKIEGLLNLLGGFTLYCPEGIDTTFLQSIYFGRHGEVNKKGLIRARKYEKVDIPGNALKINQDAQVFFEIKFRQNGKIDKKRTQASYGTLVEKLKRPLESANWICDQTGFGKKESLDLAAEFDNLELYPQLAIITKRQHLHSIDPEFNCRLTIDRNIRYYAFQYSNPWTGHEIGREPLAKIEYKSVESNDELFVELEKIIQNLGGIAIDTLQGKVEAICKESIRMFGWKSPDKESDPSIESTPMHSLRNMETVFKNEFDAEEFEMKAQITPLQPLELITEIRDRLLNHRISGFKLLDGKHEISWWTYFMDYYGYEDCGKIKVAFDVVRHPDKDKFMVQFKEDGKKHKGKSAFVVARKEFKFRVERKFKSEDLELLLAYYSELVSKEIVYVGTNCRKKYYLFLYNQKSQRYYNLGIDLNKCNGEQMVQLEIEYKGKLPQSKSKDDQKAVLSEMCQLSDEFKAIPGFNLVVTELRKFDWIKSIRGLK